MYILIEDSGTDRLIINNKDNYVRGLDEGEILAARSDAGIIGRVYDANGNDIAEPTTNAGSISWEVPSEPYANIANRGFDEITRSIVAIRITDSAFNLDRTKRNWRFLRTQISA